MPRTAIVYACAECGTQSAQWHGQCPGCEAWNTLVEERVERTAPAGRRAGRAVTGAGASGARAAPLRLAEVAATAVERLSTGIGELDRVLGGGLVPGSLVLLGGSPGIGKSTLTNMVLANLQGAGASTLYVSGEESAE
jgi:DNA repair protein RadA/Sms